MRKSSLRMVAAALPLAVAGVAQASFTFPAFDPTPGQVTTSWRSQDLLSLTGGSVPAGAYVSATVLVDWVGNSMNSGQWSSEARAHFATGAATGTSTTPTLPSGATAYSLVTSPANGATNANDVTDLRFNVGFNSIYAGGTDPLFLNFRQTFAGSNASWTNVRVTLNPVVTPTAEQAFLGGSIETTIVGPQILWYVFDVTDGGTYTFTTVGSTRTDTSGVLDTEIAIYSTTGTKLAENDDADAALTSRITIDLVPGTYYLSAGLFNTTFGGFFNVSSTASASITGNLIINGLFIPEPSAIGLLAPVAAVALRRRRA